MNPTPPDHQPHGDPNGGSNHAHHRPYWQRAHRSVGFWIALILMLTAMVIYVMSDDLGGWHRGQQRQPIAIPAAN